MRRATSAIAIIVAVLAAACTGSAADDRDATTASSVVAGGELEEGSRSETTVAAASDLRLALSELRPALEAACSARLTVVYGSSGQFARQLKAGAPFDLFLSADSAYADEVERAGRAAVGGLTQYARGRLALLVRSGLTLPEGLAALSDPKFRRISIANADHAPYGRAAREALERAGVLADVEGRLVLADNAQAAVDYVASGNADAGVVPLALVVDQDSSRYLPIDPGLHGPLDQTGVVIAKTGAERTARCVLRELLSVPIQARLRDFGFGPPGAPAE